MAGIMPFGSKDRDKDGQILLKVVASVLDELVQSNEHEGVPSGGAMHANVDIQQPNRPLTKFHGLRAPSISIPMYLERISKFSGCSNECFVLSLIYIDRLITRKQIVLDSLNVHRLIITSVMLAAKFFDDHYLDNAHYGSVGGVPAKEMNVLELEFLFLIEFNLHVTPSDYEMYKKALTTKAHVRQTNTFAEKPVNMMFPPQPQSAIHQAHMQVATQPNMQQNGMQFVPPPQVTPYPVMAAPGIAQQPFPAMIQQQQQSQYYAPPGLEQVGTANIRNPMAHQMNQSYMMNNNVNGAQRLDPTAHSFQPTVNNNNRNRRTNQTSANPNVPLAWA